MQVQQVQVRLLGPVDVISGGQPRPVHGRRRKAVLAALALHPGQVVSTGLLAEIVWAEAAPATPVNTLQSHISYLRGVLGDRAAIVARPPGYLLDLGPEGTDAQVAERLLREGSRHSDPARGARLLQTALDLWRGQPLADITGLPWLEEQAGRLSELAVSLKRARADARLAAGEHLSLAPDLERLAAENPLDEQVAAQLMLALYRCGRQADALAAYQRLYQELDAELGISPGPALRDLEAAVLRQDPDLDPPAVAAGATGAAGGSGPAGAGPGRLAVPTPAQLPPAVPAFAGRDGELARLDAILLAGGAGPGPARPDPAGPAGSRLPGSRSRPGRPAAMAIAAVSGTAGVGKTTLALHWAHGAAGQFPGGQLYVNLRGFDPGGEALEPGEALRGFLAALGIPATRIPAELAAQSALFRSLLAGQPVLVVLDNARDVEQVRPLLPGSAGCAAIVTSRNHLTGLIAGEGAIPVALDLLPAPEARDLLVRRLGAERVASEPAAVSDLITGCARLPLALTIAAARAADSPAFPLAVFAAELREAGRETSRALDPFQGGDASTDVRAVFSWSYQALSPGAARMFRLLGLHPGPDAGLAAAASLAGLAPGSARGPLAELARAHLVTEPAPGRYLCHDLLRAYAAEQARAQDSQAGRDAAVRRVLDYYLHSAHQAATLLEPHLDPVALEPAEPGAGRAVLATEPDAMAWFTAEAGSLPAAVQLAAATGLTARTWQLAWALNTFLIRRGSWDDHARVQHAALSAARRSGDSDGEAHAVHGLALGYAFSGRFDAAGPQFRQALRLFAQVGNIYGQARVHNSLTWLAERDQRPAEALGHARQAIELYRAADHAAGQAMADNDIGFLHAQLGDYVQAIQHCERALAAIQELGERAWEAATWDSLGLIHRGLGDFPRSVACYERSVQLSRDLGDRFNEADTLDHLGDAQLSSGDADGARATWRRALRIYEEIGHPDGDLVRAKLHPAGAPAGAGPPAGTAASAATGPASTI
jgi:DNA-binding SARP family transcriptional activator/Tfp pilus assembly protein PilF